MTQNRLCSDSLPVQAIHNGFSNTTGLIMVQLVNLKYERERERPNEGSVVINGGKGKKMKMVRERRCKEKQKTNGATSKKKEIH